MENWEIRIFFNNICQIDNCEDLDTSDKTAWHYCRQGIFKMMEILCSNRLIIKRLSSHRIGVLYNVAASVGC